MFPAISDFLNNPEARANFRREIGLFLASDHYRGLMVDFESFPKKGQPGYVALLNELSSDLHAKGMKLYVSVQVRNEDFDYDAISAAVGWRRHHELRRALSRRHARPGRFAGLVHRQP